MHESLKEAVSTENQDDSSDSELRWLQKTQQLRVGPRHSFNLADIVSPNISLKKHIEFVLHCSGSLMFATTISPWPLVVFRECGH